MRVEERCCCDAANWRARVSVRGRGRLRYTVRASSNTSAALIDRPKISRFDSLPVPVTPSRSHHICLPTAPVAARRVRISSAACGSVAPLSAARASAAATARPCETPFQTLPDAAPLSTHPHGQYPQRGPRYCTPQAAARNTATRIRFAVVATKERCKVITVPHCHLQAYKRYPSPHSNAPLRAPHHQSAKL